MAQIELAFEQEMALERRRRDQLRKRAVNRSLSASSPPPLLALSFSIRS
jgi:hypothetical protein